MNALSKGSHRLQVVVALSIFFLLGAFSHAQDTKDFSPKLADAIGKSGRKTVAVVDFTDLQGCVTEFGRFLAEQLSLELATSSNQFEVIDRTNLKTLLQEHKLAATGIIDPQTARKVGEIAGVQALVTGTITPLGDNVRVAVKVLDAQTAKIVGGLPVDLQRNKAIDELLRKGISGGCGVATVPTDSQGGSETVTSGTAQNSPMMRVESGVRIDLKRCERRSSREVVCLFTAESLKKDVVFGMVTCSRAVLPNSMVDGKGIFQEAEWFAIGSSQGHDLCDHVATTLIQNVPVEGQAVFGGVAPEVDRIALLTLAFGFDNGDNFTLKFRNIPLRTP